MCQIILSFILLIPFFLNASEHKLTYEAGIESRAESVNLTEGSYNNRIQKNVSNLVYQGEELLPHTSTQFSINSERPDYSHIVLMGSDGTESTLATRRNNKKSCEYKLQLGTTYAKESHSISFNGTGYLSASPYSSQGATVSYQYDFKTQGTKLEIGHSYRKSSQPETYYYPSLEAPLTARPQTVRQKIFFTSAEQILTERLKTKFLFSWQQKNEERPSHLKPGIQLAAAIGNTLFAQAKYVYAVEQKTPLQNERGYLKGHTVSTSLTWEPLYDLLCTISYDLIIEDENNPRTGIMSRTGIDQYGLGLRYQWNIHYGTTLRSSYVVTNQKAKLLNILGGFEWSL